ncbi:ABC-type transport auxiliary lipoprotein family protein (plasmid) [Pseudoalteromonas espejiana]
MKQLLLIVAALVTLAGCSASIQTATQYYQFEQPIASSSRNVKDTDAQLRVQTVALRGALNNLGIAMKVDSNQIHAANYNLWGESPDVMLTAMAQQTLF